MTAWGTSTLPDVLVVKEVAIYLRCHPKTVMRKIANGELPAYRLSLSSRDLRIRRRDLLDYETKGIASLASRCVKRTAL